MKNYTMKTKAVVLGTMFSLLQTSGYLLANPAPMIDSGGTVTTNGSWMSVGQSVIGSVGSATHTMKVGGIQAIGQQASMPQPAIAPYDGPKNRYVSFDPNNATSDVAISILLPDGRTGWIDAPVEDDWGGADPAFVSTVSATPVYRQWAEDTIHVTGCVIAPDKTYELRASADGASFSSPLLLQTVPEPTTGSWADIVGSFDLSLQTWGDPNGVVNFNDINAMVKKFQSVPTAPHVTVVDLHPQWPNYVVNFADIGLVIKGFQSVPYPAAATDCQSIANCPLGGEAVCLP